jgi:anthranilate synthase component I
MTVAAEPAELRLVPSLEEVRRLARDHALVPLRHTFISDCETPVSAYLKLRGGAPSAAGRPPRSRGFPPSQAAR